MEIITDKKLLKRKSKRVASIDDTIRNICISLIDTMIKNNGVGIAAPQCNILKRIIIVQTSSGPLILINPEVISKSLETEIYEEGCLSIPGKFFQKERPTSIILKYRNIKGKPIVQNFSGFECRIVLHELDHLEGIILNECDEKNS